MPIHDDRRRILDMLATGTITAEEADELLAALGAVPSATAVAERPRYRYLRVKAVTSGADNVDVRIPLQLIRSGLKLGSLLPAGVGAEVEGAIAEKTGHRIDLSKLRPEDIEELLESLNDLTINIASKDTVVRVSCE
ncbi:MAG: SHOCT-like domain-containing protein [Planctomycetota bacterium]